MSRLIRILRERHPDPIRGDKLCFIGLADSSPQAALWRDEKSESSYRYLLECPSCHGQPLLARRGTDTKSLPILGGSGGTSTLTAETVQTETEARAMS
ncbi:hypothetical protein RRG08_035211 [Elysia crispata]|uniref:Uncharacterized protein n=1 Tax=Elysia crispata TaxID=231223 RepID=A0AAE1DJK4_9GAST|nr:hypothetical protein RRG08_035211 [Elysia crispata]